MSEPVNSCMLVFVLYSLGCCCNRCAECQLQQQQQLLWRLLAQPIMPSRRLNTIIWIYF